MDNNYNKFYIGCSHGKNSIIVLETLIEQIRNKWKQNEKVIEIFHSDLSVNDFSKLFNEYQIIQLISYSRLQLYIGSLYNIAFSDRLPVLENYYIERLLNVLNNRYNELKVGGVFSCNILIEEDQGSENEQKSKSSYYCLKNVKEILREMSYESILSREEVENMVVPLVHLTRDEYQYAIDKSTNNTDLKLIYENKITTNFMF
ncbi:hypothetical protein ACTFIT_012125 [Dictyostelium discoideum]